MRDEGATTPAAPPGWYPTPDGRFLWWDGAGWHTTPPPRPLDPAWAIAPHLGFFVLPVLGALGVRLMLGVKDDFIKHHATEALNVQIWFAIAWNGVMLPIVITMTRTTDESASTWFLWSFASVFVIFVSAALMSVLGAVRAHQRRWWRYPLVPLRFVRGARRRNDLPS